MAGYAIRTVATGWVISPNARRRQKVRHTHATGVAGEKLRRSNMGVKPVTPGSNFAKKRTRKKKTASKER